MKIEKFIENLQRKKTGKRQKAVIELLNSLTRSSFRDNDRKNYDNWLRSWIFPKLEKLLSELKNIELEI